MGLMHRNFGKSYKKQKTASQSEARAHFKRLSLTMMYDDLRDSLCVHQYYIHLSRFAKHVEPKDSLIYGNEYNLFDIDDSYYEKSTSRLAHLALISPEIIEACVNDNDTNDYDDDSIPLGDIIARSKAITPDLPIEEPDNFLSMGDEDLDTIPSVENLVPIPRESEGLSDMKTASVDMPVLEMDKKATKRRKISQKPTRNERDKKKSKDGKPNQKPDQIDTRNEAQDKRKGTKLVSSLLKFKGLFLSLKFKDKVHKDGNCYLSKEEKEDIQPQGLK
ncbi:hypothetical protein Tco_0482400 [Tanacetum coccineum]